VVQAVLHYLGHGFYLGHKRKNRAQF
jgi:hypothetical protein